MSSNRVISIRGTGTAGEDDAPVDVKKSYTPTPVTSKIKHKGLKVGGCAFIACVAIVAIALGAIFPSMVNKQIEDAVLKTIRYDPNKMDADKLDKLLNNTSPMDFYMYQVTNLKEALTTGEKLNFQQVGPIKTTRINYKYNVSWDLDNSKLSYKQLTTYSVWPESEHFLNKTIVAVNAFYVGASGATMQQFTAKAGVMNVDFPYVQDNVLQGLLLGLLMTGADNKLGVLKQFVDQRSDLMLQIRGLGMAFYVSYLRGFCAQIDTMTGVPGTLDRALNGWATATPYLGTNATFPSVDTEVYFKGFELSTPLNSANANTTVAHNLFDPSNNYGFASLQGIQTWSTYATLYRKGLPTAGAVRSAIKAGTGLTSDTDFLILLTWFSNMTTTDPIVGEKYQVGSAYLHTICTTIKAALENAVNAAPTGTTPFQQLFDEVDDFAPTTWIEVASLQFGTGAVIGVGTQSPSFFTNGIGVAFSDVSPTYTGPTSPWNFDNLASPTTKGQAEPMELTSGAKYAHTWRTSESPLTNLHVTADPSLLYFNEATSTMKVLTIAESVTLLNALTAAAPNFLMLTSGLVSLVTSYATAFQTSYATTSNLGTARATARATVQGTLVAYQAYVSAPPTCADEGMQWTTAKLMLDAGVTQDNFYLLFTYLYSYLGNELTGSLAQLDDDGIAPQNSGLFSKRTIGEHLFGYNARFPDQAIPGVAGIRHGSKPLQELLNADYALKQGRDTAVNTGHADPSKVSQFYQYEGVARYASNCELIDPARKYACATVAGAAARNYTIWGEAEVIAGHGDASNSPPFLEKDDQRLESIDLYVHEARRSLKLKYTKDVVIQDIKMRRYEVAREVLANLSDANPQKNNYKYKQGTRSDSPDGFFRISRTNNGAKLFLSKPYWDFAAPDWDAGVTCTSPDGVTKVKAKCTDIYGDEFNTHVDFEPITGLVMSGHKRLQANVQVSAFEFYTGGASCPTTGTTCAPVACAATTPAPNSYSAYFGSPLQSKPTGGLNFHYNRLFQTSPTLMLPYYWADLHDEIKGQDQADFLKARDTIGNARSLSNGIYYTGVVAGSVGFVVAAGCVLWFARQK